MRGLNKERRQPPQKRMSTSAPQIAAPRQLEKQVKKTFTSVDGMELKSLPPFSKEYMNKEITDCDGTISIPCVGTVYTFCKIRLATLFLLMQEKFSNQITVISIDELKKDVASLKWDIRMSVVKKTETDNIIEKAVGKTTEVPLKAQVANQRAATQPQSSPGKKHVNFYSYTKIKAIKVIFYIQLHFKYIFCFFYIFVKKATKFSCK